MEEENELFGKGFIYCLVNFAKHFDKVFYDHNYSLFVGGATDHLEGLIVPENLPESTKKKVATLKGLCIHLKAREFDEPILKDDYDNLRNLLNEIALEIDEWLGIQPKAAKYD